MEDNQTAARAAVSEDELALARELIEFIEASPSMFHTTATSAAMLDAAGFTYLPETAPWSVQPGGSYYTTRNNSSIIAFTVGAGLAGAGAQGASDTPAASGDVPYHFQLSAAHGDSPTFKLKANPVLTGPQGTLRLDVEAYGGMIDYTWFDRPLSLAGRVLVREGDRVESRLVSLDRDVAIIPSLAIHLDRSMNDGFSPNRAVDLCPLISAGELDAAAFDALIAEAAGAAPEQVLARDLFLVNRQHGRVWGAASEFVSSPKLDDLMCAFMSLKAFLSSANDNAVLVWCCFDNEEVGSNTKQGAMSTFLVDTLERLNAALGKTPEELACAIAKSMLVSCDNAHAVHPNRAEKHDSANQCRMNGGIVIKEAANQHYCTDAFSRAVFQAACDRAGVPYQTFANRSDMAGGSTLGNLSNTQVSMHAVDVGCPQLAMHSSYETAGARDVSLAMQALKAYFCSDIRIDGAVSATFEG